MRRKASEMVRLCNVGEMLRNKQYLKHPKRCRRALYAYRHLLGKNTAVTLTWSTRRAELVRHSYQLLTSLVGNLSVT